MILNAEACGCQQLVTMYVGVRQVYMAVLQMLLRAGLKAQNHLRIDRSPPELPSLLVAHASNACKVCNRLEALDVRAK